MLKLHERFVTYGVIIYLLSELVPVTVFYFILYVLQTNLTSTPMISFIFQSQLVYNAMTYHVVDPANQMKSFLSIVSLFYGIWNLSFFEVEFSLCHSTVLSLTKITDNTHHISSEYLYNLSFYSHRCDVDFHRVTLT